MRIVGAHTQISKHITKASRYHSHYIDKEWNHTNSLDYPAIETKTKSQGLAYTSTFQDHVAYSHFAFVIVP